MSDRTFLGTGDGLRLEYVFDAFCGWSYGFTPSIVEVAAALPDASIRFVSGGLFTDERRAPLGNPRHTKAVNKHITQSTGVAFGEGFNRLVDTEYVMDSAGVATTLAAIRQANPVDEAAAVLELQRAFYVDGIDVADPAAVLPHAAALGVDPNLFAEALNTDQSSCVAADFARTTELGVRVFPTLFAAYADDELEPILTAVATPTAIFSRLAQRKRAALARRRSGG